jgi:hypothetical protein
MIANGRGVVLQYEVSHIFFIINLTATNCEILQPVDGAVESMFYMKFYGFNFRVKRFFA